jgi:hypothetical protein
MDQYQDYNDPMANLGLHPLIKLRDFLLRMERDQVSSEEELEALRDLMEDFEPSPFNRIDIKRLDLAEVWFDIRGHAKDAPGENGLRGIRPRAIPAVCALCLSGGRRPGIYDTTSEKRRAQGWRPLHYVYLFFGEQRMHHLITLERILRESQPGKAVKLGKQHRDLRDPHDETRSSRDRKTREAAIQAALQFYDEGRVPLPISRADYDALLRAAFDYMDHGPVLSRDTLKAAAE